MFIVPMLPRLSVPRRCVRGVALACLLAASTVGAQERGAASARNALWPVRTREFVDLWLHGFALLVDDSARVPLFRRGYRDAVTVEKNRRNLVTDLDANADRLRGRLAAQPSLANAQFAVLAFESEDELNRGLEAFFTSNGDPRRARNAQSAQMVSYLAGYFPTADDREWARAFANALGSERTRFFHAWWTEEQARRAAALATADSLWRGVLRPALGRFLGVTKQDGGTLVPSVVLEGEGRTALFGPRQNVLVVPLPERSESAVEALYVAAHELVGVVVGPVIEDNVTPAQKRAGEAERLSAVATVRGGLMLLQRAAPAMAEGYARFYLRVAGVAAGADPMAALEGAFPLDAAMVETLRRHIELSFGGI